MDDTSRLLMLPRPGRVGLVALRFAPTFSKLGMMPLKSRVAGEPSGARGASDRWRLAGDVRRAGRAKPEWGTVRLADAAARCGGGGGRAGVEAVHRGEGATVTDSIIMDDTEVGAGCVIRRAIIDKRCIIPPGTRIGVDPEEDADRFRITEGGIVVIPKEQAF